MNFKNISQQLVALTVTATALLALNACSPDEFGNGNGLSDPAVDASFSITPVASSPNKFTLHREGTNVLWDKWDAGEGFFKGSDEQEIFIPDAGTYTISHTAIGRGGLSSTASQSVTVTTSDPSAGNLVKGGKFLNADDYAQWTILHISGTATNWTFNAGSATINGGSSSQQGIYQAIQVEAGKKYKVDMKVSGSGATNTWFEVYVSPTAPTQNSDYSAGGKLISLNTWAGCGNGPFSGQLAAIGCSGSGPIYTATATGTVYLVIKSGGDNLGTSGITITNVVLRGQPN